MQVEVDDSYEHLNIFYIQPNLVKRENCVDILWVFSINFIEQCS